MKQCRKGEYWDPHIEMMVDITRVARAAAEDGTERLEQLHAIVGRMGENQAYLEIVLSLAEHNDAAIEATHSSCFSS